MRFFKVLPFLFMSMFLLGGFAPEVKSQTVSRCDFWFENNSYTLVSAAVFQTSQDQLIYTNTPPGGTQAGGINYRLGNDNFTYIVTFPAATTKPITVDVYFDNTSQGIQTIPVGVTYFILTVPGPLPAGAIYVYLN